MRKLCRFTSFILILSMIISLASCGGEGKDKETTAVETEPPIDPVAVETYTAAIDSLNTFTTYTQNISIKTTKYIGNEVIEETVERKCHFSNTDANEFASVITENKFIGGNSASTVEIFKAGNIYLEYKDSLDSLYTSRSTRDEYLSAQIPLAAIDLELYGTVSTDTAESAVITLEAPSSLESWVTDGDVKINNATATVKMHSDGTVDSFTYTADYVNGIAHIVSEYVIELDTKTEMTIPSVQSHSKYKSVSDIRIPKLINEALCYTSGTFAGSATSVVSASSYATGTAYEITEKYYSYGKTADDHIAKIESTSVKQDTEGSISTTETKTYKNGKLTVQNDEGIFEAEATPSLISDHISNIFSEHITSPLLMDNTTISDIGGYFIIEYTGSAELALSYEQYSSFILHGDAGYIISRSQSYSTDNMSGYICIEMDTMLPCSIGISFSGNHIINEKNYPIYCTVSQQICAGDITAYREITGEFVTEKEPEEKAQPLFYKISTNDGNTLYILSTVAVGDEKTAFLPKEIYDALDSSQKVALEVDNDALNDAVKTDSELATLVLNSSYYTDGTTQIDHLIDEELYSNAARIMKAAGCYVNFDIMRPSMLKIYFANNHVTTSNKLRYDKSPESRIIHRAQNESKEIISIRSFEDIIGMHASYSDEAQKYILKDIINESRQQYMSNIIKLYELWCSGNEEDLKNSVREKVLPDDASEEDYNAYMEYYRISTEEPAKRILEAVKEYLKGDSTVFCVIDITYLLCENGIIDGLRAEGYTVEQVIYESDEEAA